MDALLSLSVFSPLFASIFSHFWKVMSCCCCSVAQSCLTLCDPMDWSMSGLPVPQHLLEFAQVHVHWFGDAIPPSHPLSTSSPSAWASHFNKGLNNQKASQSGSKRGNGCEFEWTPWVGDGQGALACCDSWGCKESDTTEQLNWLNWTELNFILLSKKHMANVLIHRKVLACGSC